MPGHFDGRMQEAVNKAVERAMSEPNGEGRPGFVTQGAFYEIFKKYDFFDVADIDNKLTKEQRAQVPMHAQYRYSNFANAIAEMFQFFFNDEDDGILNAIDDIVLKLDASTTMANEKANAIGKTMQVAGSVTSMPGAPNPALLAGNKVMQIKEFLTGWAMGVDPWDLDVISPIASGISYPDIPVAVMGNFQLPGFSKPDYDFLYNHENIKSEIFYQTGDGGLKIGCGIDVKEYTDITLSEIFSVVSAVSKTQIVGKRKGGVVGEDFNIIKVASKLSKSNSPKARGIVTVKTPPKSQKPAVYEEQIGELDNVTYDDIRNLVLNEDQIRCSFYELIKLKYWDVITNNRDWPHGHWGVLTNNALPNYVRTALFSFIRTNGLSIEPGKSDDAALISYLITIGLYYYIGWQYPVKLMAVPEVDMAWVSGNIRSPESNPLEAGNNQVIEKLPKSKKIAKIYWQWAADFLVRFTYDAAGPELGYTLRKRRVAEANLIYEELGKVYPFFSNGGTVELDEYHTEDGLRARKFDKLLNVLYDHDFFRYGNGGSAGGTGPKQELGIPEPTAKLYYTKVKDKTILESAGNNGSVVKIIRHLLDKAGVESAVVTSTMRDPAGQAVAMFNNLNDGEVVPYRPAGQSVVDVYLKEKKILNLGDSIVNGLRIPARDSVDVKQKMTQQVISVGPPNVSKHCGDFNKIIILDISPNGVKYRKNAFKAHSGKTATEVGHGIFINTFLEAATIGSDGKPGLVSRFLFPHEFSVAAQRTSSNDPVFHIEIKPDTEFGTSANAALPTVAFRFKNEDFKTAEGRKAPFANDITTYAGLANAEYKESVADAKSGNTKTEI